MFNDETLAKIDRDFSKDSSLVENRLTELLKIEKWISKDLIASAIIKLSNGDLNKIDRYIKIAEGDPRDVIMLADDMR